MNIKTEEFLDYVGLVTFFNKLKEKFASKKEVETLTNLTKITDPYILTIDYEQTLAFDVNEIVK